MVMGQRQGTLYHGEEISKWQVKPYHLKGTIQYEMVGKNNVKTNIQDKES